MHKTLADAGLTTDQIDHINAHGTATPENDRMEFQTMFNVFGERAKQIRCRQQVDGRSHHLGGRRGRSDLLAADARASADSADHQLRRSGSGDPVRRGSNKARDARVTAVMSNSFGFGGQNASLILTREPI
jgi:3-oxoacyl-[acyl-carrier-protein] synthase II